MARITYVQPDGSATTVEVAEGESVMRAALNNGIDGIRAECGGAAACATCQVFIRDGWADRVPAPGLAEASMLDDDDLAEGRRLSCQIAVTADLDGLIVTVAGS